MTTGGLGKEDDAQPISISSLGNKRRGQFPPPTYGPTCCFSTGLLATQAPPIATHQRRGRCSPMYGLFRKWLLLVYYGRRKGGFRAGAVCLGEFLSWHKEGRKFPSCGHGGGREAGGERACAFP